MDGTTSITVSITFRCGAVVGLLEYYKLAMELTSTFSNVNVHSSSDSTLDS